MILVEEMFNEYELIYPYYRLLEAGAEVVRVGPKAKLVYKGKSGLATKSDAGMEQVNAEDFDGLIIPGGYAPDHMRRHQAMIGLVRDMFEQNKVVAAICHAGWLLASAGVARGRRLTSFSAIKDDLINAGADWVDEEVVVDDVLITSRTPDDLPAFMRAVIKAML
jgi:protease I